MWWFLFHNPFKIHLLNHYMKKKKVLLLGATGRIGPSLVEEYKNNYKKYYDLIIGIHKKGKNYGLKTVKFDLSNIKKLKQSMKGVDVVVNLAANSNVNAKFEDLLNPNLIGTYNVLEAARQVKVKRIIIASSVHAISDYPHTYKVKSSDTPKPLNFYGASKAYGEALCSVFSHKYNLSCLAIRIGAYVSDNRKKVVCDTRHDYGHVISQRDFGQLIHKSIMAGKKVKYGVLNAISNNKHRHMELNFTKKLIGYKPKDDAYKICKAIKKSRLRK